MRIPICAALLAAGAALASAQTTPSANPSANRQTTAAKPATIKPRTKASPEKASPVKATPMTPLTIPASAVKQGDGNYRFVDSKGTAWVFRNTPFGVTRATEASLLAQKQAVAENASSTPSRAQDPDEKATAVEKGDSIEFSRPTPFGVTRWQKNKSDLTAGEQKIWDREQSKRKP